MTTPFDAKRIAKRKFPNAPGEIICRVNFVGGARVCIIGMRAPLKSAVPGVTAFVILGQGANWDAAVADLDTRNRLTPESAP
jgi:hypothetical protein